MDFTPRQMADAFIKAGELPDALDALHEHLATNPDDNDMRRLRVQVYLRMGEPEHLNSALTDLQQITMNASDYYTQSVIYEQQDQVELAHTAAEKALNTAQDAQIKSRSMERLLGLKRKSGRLEEALHMAMEKDWVQWVADAAADLKDDVRAIEYYNRSLERVEKLSEVTSDNIAANIRARVLVKRGAAYQRMANYTQANSDYTAALEIIPDDWGIQFNRGMVLAHLERIDEAKTLIKHALESAPDSQRTHLLAELESDTIYAELLP